MPLKWITKSNYVDVETGEKLTILEIDKYIIIRTRKITRFNATHTIGYITRNHECIRKPAQQGKLFE